MFTDTHCHLDFPELSGNIESLLSACADNKIHQIIVPSVSPKNWQDVLQLAKQSSNSGCAIFSALGIHPWYLDELSNDVLISLEELMTQQNDYIIAVGETGIDGKIAEQKSNLQQQIYFFEYHIELAKKFQLPLIIHHRKSHQHIMPLLKHHTVDRKGVIHAFSGSYQQAKAYLDLGFKLGIGGTITYPRAEKTIKTLRKLPLDAIVLETDAPSMPLDGYQGQPNSPLRIINVFDTLCALRNESTQEIAVQLEINKKALFNI